MLSKELKKRIIFELATKSGWLLVLFLGALTRTRWVGREHLEQLTKARRPTLICIWHGRILLPIYCLRKIQIHAMVSEHRDGEMLATTLKKLGYGTVRGSSTRGGSKAAIHLIRHLRAGGFGAIIPDGPKGPRYIFKKGALTIARKSGAVLLPVSFSADRTKTFRSWDRFKIWLPLANSILHIHPPVEVPPILSDEQLETFRLDMQEKMQNQIKTADAYFKN